MVAISPEARIELVKMLAAAFERHHLSDHLVELRKVWRQEPGCWSDDFLVRWCALLRLPEYETVMEVRQRGAACRCSSLFIRTVTNLPGGFSVECGDCHTEWLCLEA